MPRLQKPTSPLIRGRGDPPPRPETEGELGLELGSPAQDPRASKHILPRSPYSFFPCGSSCLHLPFSEIPGAVGQTVSSP